MMLSSVILSCLLLSVTFALDCNGPADVVIAIPGSSLVSDAEFSHVENFLLNVSRYYDLDSTQIGLILYGNGTQTISGLKSSLDAFDLNTRITLLSQRSLYDDVVSGEPDLASAIQAVHAMLKVQGRNVPVKIGVIMTYGSIELDTSDNETDDSIMDEILEAAESALEDGIVLYATSSNGSIPYFPNITHDTCRLFSLGDNSNLHSMVSYLASSMCYIINGSVTAGPSDCFPEVKDLADEDDFEQCPDQGITFLADPTNCAYWYFCVEGRAYRKPCPAGTLFDASIRRCNTKEETPCFTNLSCPAPQGLFPHPTDCDKFLNCFENVPRVSSCPAGTMFNPDKLYCDFADNVDCQLVRN